MKGILGWTIALWIFLILFHLLCLFLYLLTSSWGLLVGFFMVKASNGQSTLVSYVFLPQYCNIGDVQDWGGQWGLSSLLWSHIKVFRVQAIHPGCYFATSNTQTNNGGDTTINKDIQIQTQKINKYTNTHDHIVQSKRKTEDRFGTFNTRGWNANLLKCKVQTNNEHKLSEKQIKYDTNFKYFF